MQKVGRFARNQWIWPELFLSKNAMPYYLAWAVNIDFLKDGFFAQIFQCEFARFKADVLIENPVVQSPSQRGEPTLIWCV